MITYFVDTLARYDLVDAESEADARALGHAALYDLYSDVRERLGRETPIDIQTARPATADEIQLCRWHHEMISVERE